MVRCYFGFDYCYQNMWLWCNPAVRPSLYSMYSTLEISVWSYENHYMYGYSTNQHISSKQFTWNADWCKANSNNCGSHRKPQPKEKHLLACGGKYRNPESRHKYRIWVWDFVISTLVIFPLTCHSNGQVSNMTSFPWQVSLLKSVHASFSEGPEGTRSFNK